MKVVMAVEAHITPRNEVTQIFANVARRHVDNAALGLPWRTASEETHCKKTA